ncbi:MAG: YifB family Mg chelatase-like AAA ATPase [Deltaproteobacteria bacterium]|nr:YifB family Mg chelatase-like AAA ATPase [Deltaproteobacteria bacterium]
MLARVCSSAVLGVEAYRVDVEVDMALGLPNFSTVGLGDGAVRESRVRVESALKNSMLDFPRRRISVNLAPADVRKGGTGFDLPIAIGLVSESQPIQRALLAKTMVAGELGLDGEVRRIPGAMSMAVLARKLGITDMLLPVDCAKEAAVVGGVRVRPVRSLKEAVAFFTGKLDITPIVVDPTQVLAEAAGEELPDLEDVKGQAHVKRALEVAAAGGHNLLMVGPPGSGKTLLARRLPSILPPMTFEEAIETSQVYSIMGLMRSDSALVARRPFRSPHHTVSDAGMVGGGSIPRPGEVSLAHHGVLFLDELPEFRKNVLEVLRQPIEDREVYIARAAMTLRFPARFMLVAAMNPCPCGYQTDPNHLCLCSPQLIQRYRSRISGPLLDRIDIQVEVPAVPYRDLVGQAQGEPSRLVRARVVEARQVQQARFKKTRLTSCNAQMSPAQVQRICKLAPSERSMLQRAVRSLGLSARAFDRILKVARTIADLDGKESIAASQLAEAIQYRSLDRSLEREGAA